MTSGLSVREFLLIGAAVSAAIAFVALACVWLSARGTGFRPALRGGVTVVGSDTGVGPSLLLTHPVLGLRGRPDYVLEVQVGSNRLLVPLEVKPTRRSTRLYDSDAIQLGAYLITARATFGKSAADFGFVHYAEQSFCVQLTDDLERRVREMVRAIRVGRTLQSVSRTHRVRARCARCAMRAHCNEAL